MKHSLVILFLAAAAVLSAAEPAKPAAAAKPAAQTAKPAAQTTVLSPLYRSAALNPDSFADADKAAKLIEQRTALTAKIHAERKRILTEDAAAKKLREEILLLNRKLASLLESKKSMIELNSQLLDVDMAISRLKPAAKQEQAPDAAKQTTKE